MKHQTFIILTLISLLGMSQSFLANKCNDLMKKKEFYDAADVCQKMAKKGDISAQFAMGLLYYEGNGMMVDLGKAHKWWRKAAQKNHTDAQYNLGIMLASGQGGDADLVEAYAWLKIAADNGSAAAKDSAKQLGSELSSGEKKQANEKIKQLKKEYKL